MLQLLHITTNDAGAASTSADPLAGLIGAIVVLVLLTAGVAVLVLWLRRRSREKARVAAMSSVEREHHDAVAEFRSRIARAEKGLDAEITSRTSRLKTLEKALASAQAIGTRKVAGYRGKDGSAHLTALDVSVPQGTFPLTPTVNATVDTAGNLATSSRSTLTRIAAGGLLFGPVGAIVGGGARKTKIHDMRELYLLIEGETFAAMITCNPDDAQRVRQFAVAVKQAALNVEGMRRQRTDAVALAENALAWEKQNTAPVDSARTELQRVSIDTGRVDVAARALDAERAATARADAGPFDGAQPTD